MTTQLFLSTTAEALDIPHAEIMALVNEDGPMRLVNMVSDTEYFLVDDYATSEQKRLLKEMLEVVLSDDDFTVNDMTNLSNIIQSIKKTLNK